MLLAHETTLDADPDLERALRDLGFQMGWTVRDMAGPCLVADGVHRRGARPKPVAREEAWAVLSRAFAR